METKGNYLLIGLFTLLGFLGLLGFVAWFSKFEMDRQFTYYDAYFTNVSGLDRASSVRFAGLDVGQVVDMRLSEAGDGRVRVRLELAHDTPVRRDSIATIEAQGVTGVSFVGISSGAPDQPLLTDGGADGVPDITTGKSTLQSLTEDAPLVLEKTLDTLNGINAMFSPENRGKIEVILDNLASASANLDNTLNDFSAVAENVGTSVESIAGFTDELSGISESVTTTLSLAENALTAIESFSSKAEETLDAGTRMLNSADDTVKSAGGFIDNELATAVTDLTATSASLRAQTEALGGQATSFLEIWSETGTTATARLQQAEALFAQTSEMVTELGQAISSVDSAAVSFETLMTGDGTELVAEARTAVATADAAMQTLAQATETDLPLILEDVRAATASISQTVATVGADLSSASGRIDTLATSAETTLAQVTETFARANTSLELFDQTLGAADLALGSADKAFASADKVITQDLSPITERLSASLGRLDTALDQIGTDLPGISASVRDAATGAETLVTDLSRLVRELDAPVSNFAENALPQYSAFASEARQLVRTLDSLTRKIERDPGRFFFGGNSPQYRR